MKGKIIVIAVATLGIVAMVIYTVVAIKVGHLP
jgi:hypothetical protein